MGLLSLKSQAASSVAIVTTLACLQTLRQLVFNSSLDSADQGN
jgi:hypothetical protein